MRECDSCLGLIVYNLKPRLILFIFMYIHNIFHINISMNIIPFVHMNFILYFGS